MFEHPTCRQLEEPRPFLDKDLLKHFCLLFSCRRFCFHAAMRVFRIRAAVNFFEGFTCLFCRRRGIRNQPDSAKHAERWCRGNGCKPLWAFLDVIVNFVGVENPAAEDSQRLRY